MNDFLIVGGGVIGMMMARQLADAGADVTLLERGHCGQKASWAGGGIVSPLYPWRYSEEVTALASQSQSSYQPLTQALLDETGIDPELRSKGLLYLRVADEADALAWSEQAQRPLEVVDGAFLYDKEPEVAPGHDRALWMPDLASVRNPRLCQALRASLVARSNVRLLEESEVTGLEVDENSREVLGVRGRQMMFAAKRTVLCNGAWAGELLSGLGVASGIKPVRGQMIAFKAEPGLLDRVVLMDGRYLIPRSDGHILAGSTLEYTGFDDRTSEDALASLKESAYRLMPKLRDYPVAHHWAGLRPGSVDGIPWIGAVPGYENLYINAGHFRNGLVLAPAATRLLSDQLLGQATQIDPAPYQPEVRQRVLAETGGSHH